MNHCRPIRPPSTTVSSSSTPIASISKSPSHWASKIASPWSSAATMPRISICKKSPKSPPSLPNGAPASATNFLSAPTASAAGASATIFISPSLPKSWISASSTAPSLTIKSTSSPATLPTASSTPSASSPSLTTATTSRPTTPSPSSAKPPSPDSPSSVRPSPISPANSPPPTSAASTMPSTPSTRTPPPWSAPSANPQAFNPGSPCVVRSYFSPLAAEGSFPSSIRKYSLRANPKPPGPFHFSLFAFYISRTLFSRDLVRTDSAINNLLTLI